MTSEITAPTGTPGGDFFLTPELAQRLNLVQHLLVNSDQLLLIMAERGAGKTIFLRQILANAQENWKLISLTGSPTIVENTLFSALNQAFRLSTDSTSLDTLADALRVAIAAARFNGEMPILCVDDAHMLPLETLRWLIELSMTGQPHTRLRLLMGCEPQITSLFVTPEFGVLRNSLIHTLDIPPFSPAQAADYLRAKFPGASWDSAVVRQWHAQANGLPGGLQHLASARPAWSASTKDAPTATTTPARLAQWLKWGGAIALASALASGLAWFGLRQATEPAAPRSQTAPSPAPAQAEVPHKTVDLPLPAENPPPDLLSPQFHQLPPAPVLPPAPPSATPPKPPLALPPPTSAAEESPPAQTGAAQPTPLPDSAWLRQQDPNAYTVQLMGSHELDSVRQFIQHHGLTGDLAVFKASRNNKDWFVLVQGVYPTRQAAEAAKAQLPPAVRATQPWARSLKSVQGR